MARLHGFLSRISCHHPIEAQNCYEFYVGVKLSTATLQAAASV